MAPLASAASAAASLDGFPLAQRGQAGYAMALATAADPWLLAQQNSLPIALVDPADIAGAVAALREVDVSGALARWQLLVDENSTGAFEVVRDLDF